MVAATIALVLLILANAFYVLVEFAAVGVRKTIVEQMAEEGNARAAMLHRIISSPPRLDTYVAGCQIGITVTSLVLGAIGQAAYASPLAGQLMLRGVQEVQAFSLSVTLVLLALVSLQVIFGELLPKSLAMRFPAKLAVYTVIPMRWSLGLFAPLLWLLNGSSNVLLRLFRIPARAHGHTLAAEEIDLLVEESHEGGLLEDVERERLHNVLRLAGRRAREVMIPRTRIYAVDVQTPEEELVEIAATSAFTRIPVYRETLDDVLGVVHVKDLLALSVSDEVPIDLSSLLREIPRVLTSTPVTQLLTDMRARHIQMALVVDEYGGTSGIVTLEDLLEEVVGDIPDEYAKDEELKPVELPDGRYRLSGSMLLSDINDQFHTNLSSLGADTLTGYVMGRLGRLPEVGDQLTVEGGAMEIETLRSGVVGTALFSPEAGTVEEDADDV